MSTILIAGNIDSVLERLEGELIQEGFQVECCRNAGQMMKILAGTSIDVIVADSTLSRTPWIELSHAVNAAAPDTQVILLSENPDFETASQAFRNYVFDFMDRSSSPALIIRSVSNASRFKALNAERHELLGDETRYLGHLDQILQNKTAAFHASESKWRTLIDTIPDLVWLKNTEGRYIACNRRYEEFIGRTESELIGRTDNHFESESITAVYKTQDDKVLDSNDPQVNEVEVRFDSDAHVETLETIKVPLFMPDGTKIGVLGVGRNVSRRKELELLTRIQAERAEALMELLKIGSGADENAVLLHCLSIIEKMTQSRGSIIFFHDTENETLVLGASSFTAITSRFESKFESGLPVNEAGTWARFIDQTSPQILNRFANEDADNSWLDKSLNLSRLAVCPVTTDKRVTMLVAAANKAEEYTESDLDTLILIAQELWQVISHTRTSKTVNRFNRVLDRSLSEIFIFDSESLRFLDSNQGARLNLDFSQEELSSMTPFDIYPHFGQKYFEDLLEPLRSGLENEITTSAIQCRKDGTKYPVEVSLQFIDEDPPVFVAIAHDIGERVRMEEELRKLAQAVEQSPESIVITNEKAEIEYVNQAFIIASGYSREELVGRNPGIKKSGKTPPRTYEKMWKSLNDGLPWKGEFYNRRKDGSEYTEMAHLAPIKLSDGTITHYLGVLEDITEKKKLAEELDQHRNHLEHLVEERTAALAEAQQKAESASEAKSAFLAMMSHEIRTPINAIVGLTHLLKRSDTNPEQSQQLGKIEASAEFLMSIINDILDLSKIEAGKLELEESEFHLGVIFNHVHSLMFEQAKAKGLELRFEQIENPGWIVGDATRLRHALINYVNNAIKFSEQGTIDVRAQLLEESNEQLMLKFEVEDQGIGIDEDRIAGLFDDFQQADVSTTRKFGGTGLGLAITRRLATLMGGSAGASSVPGKGSIFWFTATVRRGKGEMRETRGPDLLDAESALRNRHENCRVLLVEDNAINREVALALLNESTLTVHTAENGLEAVRMTMERNYDLILMDLQMPEMDGLEATRKIRTIPAYCDVPILAMTANVFAEDRARCRKAGMNDFVAKPVEPKSLYSTILRWLDENEMSPQGHSSSEKDTRAPNGEYSATVNPEALDKIFGNDQAARAEILEAFISQSADTASEIGTRFEQRDADKISFQAHKLKSSARTVGANGLADLCFDLELAGRESRWTDIGKLVARLHPLVEQITDRLTH